MAEPSSSNAPPSMAELLANEQRCICRQLQPPDNQRVSDSNVNNELEANNTQLDEQNRDREPRPRSAATTTRNAKQKRMVPRAGSGNCAAAAAGRVARKRAIREAHRRAKGSDAAAVACTANQPLKSRGRQRQTSEQTIRTNTSIESLGKTDAQCAAAKRTQAVAQAHRKRCCPRSGTPRSAHSRLAATRSTRPPSPRCAQRACGAPSNARR